MSEYRVSVVGPRQAVLAPADRPDSPLAPDEVVGKTVCTLVSPGTELTLYVKQAFHPGYAAVFQVESVGAEVTDLSPGQLAFCMGNHCSFQRVRHGDVLPLPEGLPPARAVFARLLNVAFSTLTTTAARPPAMVLVTGLGIVGHLGAKLFAACGYQVLGVDPLASRRELLAREGVCRTAAAVPLDDPAWQGKVELALECSGHEEAALAACRVVRKGGEVVLVGVPWTRRADRQAFDLLHAVFHNYVVLRSGWEWEVPLQPTNFVRGSLWENMAAGLRWIADGRINVAGLCQVRPPGEAQEAYQDLLHNRCPNLTVLFDWT